LWARLLVVFGSVLAVLSAGVVVVEKILVATTTSRIPQKDLLGGAGRKADQVELRGPLNVLLIGIDERPDQAADQPSRADSIIIVHVPATHDSAYLISIPRDTLVHIPPDKAAHYPGGNDKINAAYAFGSEHGGGRAGGAQLLAATIKLLTGTGFDAAAIVNFGGFQKLVDALGGIRMYVDEETVSVHNGHDAAGRPAVPYDQSRGRPVPIRGVTPQIYHPGWQPFDGWHALDYVRQRELLPDGDYGRQRHQQQFLRAVFRAALDRGVATDLGKLSRVTAAAGEALTLDVRGVGLDEWLFSLRHIRPASLVTVRTNNGKLVNLTRNGIDYQQLSDDSRALLRSTADDTVDRFLATHPDWIITDTS
jgi:LCP family protein required for cell wall assembly